MPGPVSDSYDPEFSTSANAQIVRDGIDEVRDQVSKYIGSDELKYIVTVCNDERKVARQCTFSERELRIIRFCLDRAKESI